ncbi:MAG: NUDIX hydrolase [Anaerolineales bacterium]
MQPTIDLALVKRALELSPQEFDAGAVQQRAAPAHRPLKRDPNQAGVARLAATLVLLFPKQDVLHFVLTKRPDNLRHHAGQMALPGGRKETHESFEDAALRETCEELGVCNNIKMLGKLAQLYIPPSDFLVQPFVGYHATTPQWRIDPCEVAQVVEISIATLFNDNLKHEGTLEHQGQVFTYQWYQLAGQQVWGATAIMLSELEWRLKYAHANPS